MKTNRCKTCGKDTLRGWDYCSGCQRIKKASEENRPAGYDTPSKPHHTPTPLEVTESGSDIEIMEQDGASISVMIDGSRAAKIKRAKNIVRAVNAHEGLAKNLARAIDGLRDEGMSKIERFGLADDLAYRLAKSEGK